TADSDRQTAQAAVFTLGTISSKRARTALKTLSEDPQHPLRVWIAVAMHRQGQPGTASRFQKLLQDKDVTIRRQAVDALATLEKFDPTDLLIKALEDQDGLVRRTATTALGNSSNPKAKKAVKNYLRRKVDELLPLLTGSDRRKQYEARKKLQMLGPPAAPLLLDQLEKTSSPTSRTLAYMIGGMRNAEVLPRVVATLRQPNLPKDRRTTFELVLLGMGEEAAEAATELLADGSDAVRESGARVLARVGGEAAADKLKAALKDKSPKVRAYAAMGLSAKQDPEALKVLEEAMRSRDAEVRNVALSALARYDSQTVLPLVRPLVETADTATAQNLLFVLSNFREAEATEGIVRLTQKHPSLANFSIYSLRRQGTPAAAQALGRLLDHKDRRVQQAARAALQRMPLPEAREILKRAEQKKAAEKTTAPKIAPKRAK
ncbi:MAG: HEAT repeat domain-containing protein, partial [Planctomycetes bacterium]|nr:HEAT repeat domain-containing protein [Planctomycetota bacterium]